MLLHPLEIDEIVSGLVNQRGGGDAVQGGVGREHKVVRRAKPASDRGEDEFVESTQEIAGIARWFVEGTPEITGVPSWVDECSKGSTHCRLDRLRFAQRYVLRRSLALKYVGDVASLSPLLFRVTRMKQIRHAFVAKVMLVDLRLYQSSSTSTGAPL